MKVLSLLVLVITFFPSLSLASDRVALLIANQDYRNGENDLKNPVNDANLIASKLKGLNFDVTVVKDGDRVAMHKAISKFGNDSKNAESAVFYYSGHGMQNKHHNNFLIPVDAKITDNDSINYTSVNVQDVIDKLDEANPKVSLVMLDACRNNKFLGTKGSRNFAVVKYKTESDGEMLVSYATRGGQVALDGQDRNSPYAEAVAEQFESANDIPLQLIFDNVRKQVKEATNNDQNPTIEVDIGYHTNLFGVKANNEPTKEPESTKPKLHTLVVGISNYDNPSLNLPYPNKDAKAIFDVMNKQVGDAYDKGNITLLNTKKTTTKSSIMLQILKMQAEVKPNDVFVFYFSGHAYSYRNNGYHVFTSDVESTKSKAVRKTGIHFEELEEILASMKANKKLVFLDTHNSGDFIDLQNVKYRGINEQAIVDNIRKQSGVAVLMSGNKSLNTVLEGYKGHSLFTYILLQAFDGKADSNNDGYLDVNEIFLFVESEMPKLSQEIFNKKQFPASSIHGQGFKLKVVN